MIDNIYGTSRAKEKNSPFPDGMLAWVPAGKSWTVANKLGKEMKLMILEFNDTAGRRSLVLGECSTSLKFGEHNANA